MPEAQPIRKAVNADDTIVREGERSVIATITTAAVDRDNEVILPRGIDLSNYRKNPTVLWAHDSYSPPIGKNVWIKRDGALGLIAKTLFAATAFADDVFRLIQGGFIKAVSVGFMPKEWREPTDVEKRDAGMENVRRVFTKCELLEYSFVPVPANPEALVTAVAKGFKCAPSLIRQMGLEPAQRAYGVVIDLPRLTIPVRIIDGAEK